MVDPNSFEAKVVAFSSKKGKKFLSLLGMTEKEAIEVRGCFDFDRGVERVCVIALTFFALFSYPNPSFNPL